MPSTFGWGCPSSRQPTICPSVSCLENPAPHMPPGHLQLNRNHVRASANRSPSSYSWPKFPSKPVRVTSRGRGPRTASGQTGRIVRMSALPPQQRTLLQGTPRSPLWLPSEKMIMGIENAYGDWMYRLPRRVRPRQCDTIYSPAERVQPVSRTPNPGADQITEPTLAAS